MGLAGKSFDLVARDVPHLGYTASFNPVIKTCLSLTKASTSSIVCLIMSEQLINSIQLSAITQPDILSGFLENLIHA
jgi:hypothetical protein